MITTLPVGQLLNASTALQKLSQAVYPAKIAFAISKNIARVNSCPDVAACEAARQATIRRLGVTDDQGNVTVPPAAMAAFQAEFQPIAMGLIELDITPIPLSALEHAPAMSPVDMMALEPFWSVE
jgi:hypothetical protein